MSRKITTRRSSQLTYSQARDRLYSLEHWGVKLGLGNITEFCEALSNPQARFLSIHIAGTNGKGSVSAFLDSILRAAGYRVGRYTSPHLRDFRERILVNGEQVPGRVVADFIDRHWNRITAKRYTYFEVATALAFETFARARIQIGIIEVGLGGRFDATNIINPAVAVITRIARDHESVLGHTASEIAFEKAGIIKPGVPLITGPLPWAADQTIRQVAEKQHAPVWTAEEILAADMPHRYESIQVPLAGPHQLTNLAIALAALRVVRTQGIEVPDDAARRGVPRTHWPARFQYAPGKPPIVYDAAHNPDGIRAVVNTWMQEMPARRAVVVFDTRSDKNYLEMINVLSPIALHWVGCPLPGAPGITETEMCVAVEKHRIPFSWSSTPRGAISMARRIAGADNAVLVTGSHYLVGAVIPPALVRRSLSGVQPKMVTRSQLLAAAEDRGPAF